MIFSLYIHIPFCEGKCDYCDFYSVSIKDLSSPEREKLYDKFLNTLIQDLNYIFEKYKPEFIPTIYIGGGTPSVLGSERIYLLCNLINSLIKTASIKKPYEFTMEGNPESCQTELLIAAREGGITRLSLGIQSLSEKSRIAVNRAGAGLDTLYESLDNAKKYFPNSFSVDLISGLPFQGRKELENDILQVLKYSPSHISLYSLTLEKDSSLYKKMQKQNSEEAEESEEADELWIFGRDFLENKSYCQYEVSNFCIEGNESLHNIWYWLMKNWHGIGPSASGTMINNDGTGFRYTNPSDLNDYLSTERGKFLSSKSMFNFEELNRNDLVKESLLMGFRYIHGPDEDLFYERFSVSIGDLIPETLKLWKKNIQKDKMALDREGLLFLNSFLTDAFLEIDKTLIEK